MPFKNAFNFTKSQPLAGIESTELDQKRFYDEKWTCFLSALAEDEYYRVINGTVTQKIDIYIHKSVNL